MLKWDFIVLKSPATIFHAMPLQKMSIIFQLNYDLASNAFSYLYIHWESIRYARTICSTTMQSSKVNKILKNSHDTLTDKGEWSLLCKSK